MTQVSLSHGRTPLSLSSSSSLCSGKSSISLCGGSGSSTSPRATRAELRGTRCASITPPLFGLATPFKALRRRHYAVVLTSAAFVLVSIVLPATTGSMGQHRIEHSALLFCHDRETQVCSCVYKIRSSGRHASITRHQCRCERRNWHHHIPVAPSASGRSRLSSTLHIFRDISSQATL